MDFPDFRLFLMIFSVVFLHRQRLFSSTSALVGRKHLGQQKGAGKPWKVPPMKHPLTSQNSTEWPFHA